MSKYVQKFRKKDYDEEEYSEREYKDKKRKKDQRKMKYFDEYESYASNGRQKTQRYKTY